MTGDDMHEELEQLRAEVAALSAARAKRQASEVEQKPAPRDATPAETNPEDQEAASELIENAKAAVADDPELKSQMDQLIEQLEHEIRDLPAVTTLAVFSLGVLFGRLLR